MRFAAPGTVRVNDRPPVATDIAPSPGAALRIPGQKRCRISPRLVPTASATGFEPSHPYVRMFWTAVIGPGPVAELLRVIAAAHRMASIPHPLFLPVLCREGLIHYNGGTVWVLDRVPPLGLRQMALLPPGLKQRHAAELAAADRGARAS